MNDQVISKIFPLPTREAIGDEELARLYHRGDEKPWLRVNFVSSIDGAATYQGLSGGLSDAADRRVFDILRRLCDVVVVGAGTVRSEGYGAMRVDEVSQHARREAGMTTHPVFAIVSASLDLDAASPIFHEAPERPLVVTTELSRRNISRELAAAADVMICGEEKVEAGKLVELLASRGLTRIHCEGGPHLFGDLVAASAVDELCVTLTPTLEAGVAPRIAVGAAPILPLRMRLAHALQAEDSLLLRYVRHDS